MSTSFSPSCNARSLNQVQSFHYPAIPHHAFRRETPDAAASEAAQKARELAMQQELAAAVETARAEGFSQGEAKARAAAAQTVEQERAAVLSAVRDFETRREDYFRRVETEAVRLALAIARKVLHREALMDPMLLAGVLRVALDQMQAGTRVILRTSAESAAIWRDFCEQHCQGQQNVEVVVDPSLAGDRCVLQAEAGSTEISIDNQLQEIENGFFDLLRERSGNEP
jgi:flagellar assembly protein FliH